MEISSPCNYRNTDSFSMSPSAYELRRTEKVENMDHSYSEYPVSQMNHFNAFTPPGKASMSNFSSNNPIYFQKNKEILSNIVYREYNNKIYENKLPKNVEIEWTSSIKNVIIKTKYNHNGILIQISNNSCLSEYTLKWLMLIELCHIGSFIINNNSEKWNKYFYEFYNKSIKKYPQFINPPKELSQRIIKDMLVFENNYL